MNLLRLALLSSMVWAASSVLTTNAANVEMQISGKEAPLIVEGPGAHLLHVNINSQTALGDVTVSVDLRSYGDKGQILPKVVKHGESTETVHGGGSPVELSLTAPGPGFYEMTATAENDEGATVATCKTTYAVLPIVSGEAPLDLNRLKSSSGALAEKSGLTRGQKEWAEASEFINRSLSGALSAPPETPALRPDDSPSVAFMAAQVLLRTLRRHSFAAALPSVEAAARIERWGPDGDQWFVVRPPVNTVYKQTILNLPSGVYLVRDWQGRDQKITVAPGGWSRDTDFLIQYWTLDK